MPVSPGIYVREFDFSDYAQRLGVTHFAIVGAAGKGPLNEPVTVTNESELTRQFGKPLLDEYGLQAAIQFLQKGDQLTFVRVANNALTASYPLPGLAGGTPAVKASGTIVFTGNNNPSDGEYVTVAKTRPIADLEADVAGAAANVTITTTNATAIKVTGLAGGSVSAKATGKIKLAAMPVDANTITISDGTTTAIFEFDSNASVTGGNISVAIVAGDPYATLSNLVTAINAAPFGISATDNVQKIKFEFDNNSAYAVGATPVLIGATALDTMVNLISAISLSSLGIDTANTTVTVPQATLTQRIAGVDGNTTLLKSGANITVTGMASGADAIAGSSMTAVNLYAKSAGTWGNGVRATVTSPSVMIGATAGNFDLSVESLLDDGSGYQLVERFTNLSLLASSDRYITAILAAGKRGEVGASEYLTADVLSGAGTLVSGTYVLGTAPGVTGTNGVAGLAANNYIGTVSGQTATGLQALRNPETTEFNLLAVPGVTDKTVISAGLALCAKRGDAVFLIDPPFGLTYTQVVDWHNGLSTIVPEAPTGPLDDSYGAMFWSWVEIEDAYNYKSVWIPPSGIVAAAMATSDRANGPYLAVAGHVRGLVNGNRVEYSPTQDERDVLNGDPNRVNPIVNFTNGGLTIFGNRTLQRRLSALNSLHIRRMLLHAEKVCATAVRVLNFDPNDEQTWIKFTLLVNKELDAIKAGRGIEEFRVICDATTNPPEQRQRKTMRGKILIKMIEAAEIILMDFALFATGADFNENAI